MRRTPTNLTKLQRRNDNLNDLTPYPTPFSDSVLFAGDKEQAPAFRVNLKNDQIPNSLANVEAYGGNAVANAMVEKVESKNNNLFLVETNKEAMLEEFLVKNAGYALANKAWGHEFDMKDQAIYAVSEWIYEYMGRDWVIAMIVPLVGLSKDSSYATGFLVELVAELLFTGAAYKILEMVTGEKRSIMKVMIASSGATIVNELYVQVLKSKLSKN